LKDGLRQNGVEVLECHDDSPGLKKYWNLFKKHWKIRNQYDAMVVGFLGHVIMPFASFINLPFVSFRSRKPIIFDAFLSLYDSNVFGRSIVKEKSLKSFYYWMIDWFSMRLGNKVLFDTYHHIDYIAEEFGISKKRMARIFVGAREDVFQPKIANRNDNKFIVLFYGTYIRSQGIEYLIDAAKLIENHDEIKLIFIGDGQVKKEMLEYAKKRETKNIEFIGFIPLAEIKEYIAKADVCLGLFGKPAKIQRVIPNKIWECVAMKKAILTGNAPALWELFDKDDICTVPVADAKSVAEKIIELKGKPELVRQMAESAHKKYRDFASTKQLGKELKNIICAELKGCNKSENIV
jgi:glycosyltransferase involved in cell wall biosynthesis